MSSSQILLLSRRTLQKIRNGSLALMDISGSEKIYACSRMYVRVIRGIHMWLSLLVPALLRVFFSGFSGFPPSKNPTLIQIPTRPG